jgi:hypothetical protein
MKSGRAQFGRGNLHPCLSDVVSLLKSVKPRTRGVTGGANSAYSVMFSFFDHGTAGKALFSTGHTR